MHVLSGTGSCCVWHMSPGHSINRGSRIEVEWLKSVTKWNRRRTGHCYERKCWVWLPRARLTLPWLCSHRWIKDFGSLLKLWWFWNQGMVNWLLVVTSPLTAVFCSLCCRLKPHHFHLIWEGTKSIKYTSRGWGSEQHLGQEKGLAWATTPPKEIDHHCFTLWKQNN